MFCKGHKRKDSVYQYGEAGYEDGEMRLERRTRGDPSVEGGDTGPPKSHNNNEHFGLVCVELNKKDGSSLGLVVTGGIDKDIKPRVSYLKPGGIAHRSDVVQEGDFIASVNGISTVLLKHDEIVSLLRGAGENIMLELEYELPEPPQATFSVLCKRIDISLDKDGDSYGFTLRGGVCSDPARTRPLTITQIRPGGAADREGTLKVGDRILAINDVNTTCCPLMEALTLLRHSRLQVTLSVEYDVSVMDAVEQAVGPLLVEIDKAAGSALGLGVTNTNYKGRTVISIDDIEPASIADRCGALHLGDHILAIDDTSFEYVSVAEATQILKRTTGSHVKLEIVPIHHIKSQSQASIDGDRSSQSSSLGQGVQLKSTQLSSHHEVRNPSLDRCSVDNKSRSMSPLELSRRRAAHSGTDSPKQLDCHSLAGSNKSTEHSGTGSHISDVFHNVTDAQNVPPGECRGEVKSDLANVNNGSFNVNHLASVNTGSVMSNSVNINRNNANNRNNGNNGLLQADKLHSSNTSLQSYATYTSMTTQMGSAANSPPGTLTRPYRSTGRNQSKYSHGLPTSNAVWSNIVVPGHQVCHSEVTEVILVSDLRGFGITLTGSAAIDEILNDPPYISVIQPRSVAERCGVLQEGDRILSINGILLEGKTLNECNNILNRSGMRVSLLVEFDVAESIIPSSGIFNVKVAKKGTGLGITIAAAPGRRLCDPLLISDVKRGSVAHRTGTIAPGDALLAIDTFRLEGCGIEDAAHILQNTENIVNLRLQKKEIGADEPVNMVTYTVELQRHGGPLGVTISGTEEPLDPIFISGLTSGGLAERTGALHIGDRILAINAKTLRGKTLTDAIAMLKTAGDTVTLKVTRPINTKSYAAKAATNNTSASKPSAVHTSAGRVQDVRTSYDSVDSALESWDSSGLDSNGKGRTRPELKREGSASSTSTSHTSHDGTNTSSYHSLGRPTAVSVSAPQPPAHPPLLLRPHSATSYNDLSGELRYEPDPLRISDTSNSVTNGEFTTSTELINRLHELGTNDVSKGTVVKPAIDPSVQSRDTMARLHNVLPSEDSSPSNSVDSSPEQDEWSQQVDALDKLGPLSHHSQADSFSGFTSPKNPIDSVAAISALSSISPVHSDWSNQISEHSDHNTSPTFPPPPPPLLEVNTSNNNSVSDVENNSAAAAYVTSNFNNTGLISSDFHDLNDDSLDIATERDRLSDDIHLGAAQQIHEVETELDAILTPTPIELHKIVLNKTNESDYGLSLSDGVYEKGVYISALRPNGPAIRAGIKPYDKILQINSVKVKDLTCAEVVPLVNMVGAIVELVISRNPLANVNAHILHVQQQHSENNQTRNRNDEEDDGMWESASAIIDSKNV